MIIPQLINRFEIYQNGGKLVGLTGEVELPSVTMLTDSMEGAGTGGNLDVPVIGLTENMELKISYMSLIRDMFSIANPNQASDLTLRGAIQGTDPATGKIAYMSLVVYARGTVKEIVPGTVKAGAKMESSVTLNLSRYTLSLDEKEVLAIDKMNGEFRIDGVDVLKEVRDMC